MFCELGFITVGVFSISDMIDMWIQIRFASRILNMCKYLRVCEHFSHVVFHTLTNGTIFSVCEY